MKDSAPAAMARGSTAMATLDFLRRNYGEPILSGILERLDPSARDQILTAQTTDHLPYGLLVAFWREADAVLSPDHPGWMEEAGAFAIDSLGQQLYGGLLRKTSPTEFMTQSVSLYRLYYSQGDMEAVEVQPGRAVVRLSGFDALGPLFCRRQLGGLRRATELAGGKSVRVKHVRCSFEGDAYCEWELCWS